MCVCARVAILSAVTCGETYEVGHRLCPSVPRASANITRCFHLAKAIVLDVRSVRLESEQSHNTRQSRGLPELLAQAGRHRHGQGVACLALSVLLVGTLTYYEVCGLA